MSVKIVFRGLLLFHQANGSMDIGVLGPAHAHGASGSHPQGLAHVPRIITTKKGVVSSVFDLRTRPELRPPGEPGHIRQWELFVVNPHPVHNTLKTVTVGPNWVRKNNGNAARDYRWLTHLDGDDLHQNIPDLQTNRLMMVLKVRIGEFYTEQLSKPLNRKTVTNGPNGAQVEFGRAAEVTGCDIETAAGGEVQLRVDDNIVFRFRDKAEDGVVYEFSNAPPDVLAERPYSPDEPGHFSQYYGLFGSGSPADRYDLVPQVDFAPAPDPALCGAARVDPRPGGF
ncbi:MAG TPA: hypothetical protein VFR78_12530 [Pyrinomonadaceae bacterium]|nr:hypothetical protein [Pyrinomonadaceae bacterium]